MVTEVDERKGLVKTYWADIRKRVANVEPTFAKIVDELNPDKSFPLFLAYYPYGSLVYDTNSLLISRANGPFYHLSDSNAPKDVAKHLGYGKDHCPFTLVLEKQLECFIDLREQDITIPWLMYSPGDFISYTNNLGKKYNQLYAPNNLLSVTSGTKSAFMLANIGCSTNHSNLKRDFGIKHPPPKSIKEHWIIFKEIINSSIIDCSWSSCLIYFSEKWIDKLHNDSDWGKLKLYLHEKTWNNLQHQLCYIYYEINFSAIQKKRNLKPNPYLVDTAKHLFTIAMGKATGYAPACNDEAVPLEILQQVFVESYGLKKYLPTIMQPIHFNFERDKLPVYYSLQNPSTLTFSPKSREVSSKLVEIRELAHIMKIFTEELLNNTPDCLIKKVAEKVDFKYFHNKPDRHHIVQGSNLVETLDERFKIVNPKHQIESTQFASDASFLRGCISIRKKSSTQYNSINDN